MTCEKQLGLTDRGKSSTGTESENDKRFGWNKCEVKIRKRIIN